MITSTKNNGGSYVILYDKANKALKNAVVGSDAYFRWIDGKKTPIMEENKAAWLDTILRAAKEIGLYTGTIPASPTDLNNDSLWANQGINSLEEYFSILEVLASINTNFQIMPLYADEEPFKIEANERKIKIPSNKNVYAVKGDHYAETIFFKIPRYFDTMDFNDTEIYIQWKINGVEGNTKAYRRDITTSNEELIFGWVLNNKITSQTGKLEFSVRFVKINEGKIKYSYSTLPETIQIQTTLEHDLSNFVDVSEDMEDLLINYPNYNTDTAGEPMFNIYINEDGEEYFNLTDVEVDPNNSNLELYKYHIFKTRAISPNTGGQISYEWKKVIPAEEVEAGVLSSSYNSADITLGLDGDGFVSEVYEKIILDENYAQNYVIYDEDGFIIDFLAGDFDEILADKLEEQVNGKKFYIEGGTEFKAIAPGTYYCRAINTFGIRNQSLNSDFVTVPAPINIEIDKTKTTEKYYLDAFKSGNTYDSFYPVDENGLKDLVIDYSDPTETKDYRVGNISLFSTTKEFDLTQGIGVNDEDTTTSFNLKYKNELNNYEAVSNDEVTITVYNPLQVPKTKLSYIDSEEKTIILKDSSIDVNSLPDLRGKIFTLSGIADDSQTYLNPYNCEEVKVTFKVSDSNDIEKAPVEGTTDSYNLSGGFYYITTTYSISNYSTSTQYTLYI